jgi:tRNA G18 (ribose-2'-O)-methylase SpoU
MVDAATISDASDPRLAPFGSVSDGERLRSLGLFVAEGRLVVRRAIENPACRIVSVVVNQAARRDLRDVFDRLPSSVPVLTAETGVLERVAGYHVHRGCLALVERLPSRSIDQVIATAGIVVVLEGVANADNGGGSFRNAAAFGAAGIIVSPTCCDPLYRKAVRTSMGAVLRLPFARAESWPDALTTIRAGGLMLVALTPREPSVPVAAFARTHRDRRMALIAGTEGGGLSPAVEAMADARVSIPMAAGTDSLDVSVAVGIALFALTSANNGS